MAVARNVVLNPRLVPGGGAVEMSVARVLTESASVGSAALSGQGKDRDVAGAAQSAVFKAVADALEVIPRTLVQNAGGNAIRVLTELRVRYPHTSSLIVTNNFTIVGQARRRRAFLGYRWSRRENN